MSIPQPPGPGMPAAATGTVPGGSGPALVPVGDVLVRALPDRLAGLERPVTLSGQVVEQKDGAATIRTAAGDIRVETPIPLPTDRPVTLRIPAQVPGTPPRATALAPPAPPAPPPAAGPIQAAAPPPAPLPAIQPGAVITAIVVAAAQPRPAPAPTAAPTAAPSPPSVAGQPAAGGTAQAPPAVSPSVPLPPVQAPPSPVQGGQVPGAAVTPVPGGGVPQPALSPLAALLGSEPSALVPVPAAVTRVQTGQPPAPAAADAAPPPPSAPATAPPTAVPLPDAATDAARLARLARFNLPSTPSNGPPSLPDFGGAPAPVPEARLRATPPTASATAPPTAPAAAPPTAGSSPAGPGQTQAPSLPAGPTAPSATTPAAGAGTAGTREGALPPVPAPSPPAPQARPAATAAHPPTADRPAGLQAGSPALTVPRETAAPGPAGQGLPDRQAPAPDTAARATPMAPADGAIPARVRGPAVPASPTAPPTAPAAPPAGGGTSAPVPARGEPAPQPSAQPQQTTMRDAGARMQPAPPSAPQPAPAAPGTLAEPAPTRDAPPPRVPVALQATGMVAAASGAPLSATRPPGGVAPADPAPARPLLPPGQPVQVRVLSIEGAMPPADTGAPTLTGTLVGNTAQGQPVVTTDQGTLVLRARTDLPPGTALLLAVDAPANRALDGMLAPLDPAQADGDWPAMREVMGALLAADPALARSVAAAILPQPTKRLTTTLTFFLSALRGGDAGGWLGPAATELLEARGQGRLLARLREDFRAAAQHAAEPAPDGWRGMPIPLGTPDHVTRAQLHVRHSTDQDGDGQGTQDGRGAARRFLLDLSFSNLGPMQLDGMVRSGRFDLMIRTRTLLPADMRQTIGTLFRESLETVGYAGTIGFQTGAHFWTRVRGGTPSRPLDV
ncbi:hypothetical protein [Niveispirillum fermenti]|uniref:hypothetical protein n=1 Tax=Niveispirillum fermenti TaxID=1233113 RepID=UPI003A89153A